MTKSIVTFKEAVEITGLSKTYLYRLTSQKVIPHSKPGGKLVFFRREDLEKWMLSAMVESSEQTDIKVAIHELNRKR